MLKDVTIGQYYSTNSILHRLDPRVKIRFALITVIILLLDRSIPLFMLFTAFYFIIVLMGNIPIRYTLRGLKSIMLFLFVCSLINLFTTPGTKIDIPVLDITWQGLYKFGFVYWRMVLMVLITSYLMYTTTPIEITNGLEKAFHMNTQVAMAITIALRYIGILFDELDRLIKAMQSRGGNIHKGGINKRLENIKIIAVPLFQNSINRASNLGEAMDSKCYNSDNKRTRYYELRYKKCDAIAYLVMMMVIVISSIIIWKF